MRWLCLCLQSLLSVLSRVAYPVMHSRDGSSDPSFRSNRSLIDQSNLRRYWRIRSQQLVRCESKVDACGGRRSTAARLLSTTSGVASHTCINVSTIDGEQNAQNILLFHSIDRFLGQLQIRLWWRAVHTHHSRAHHRRAHHSWTHDNIFAFSLFLFLEIHLPFIRRLGKDIHKI